MAQPPIFAYENLSLHQGEGWLFENLDLHVGPRDRLALIGRNGAGKTTLLRLIADQIEADKGQRDDPARHQYRLSGTRARFHAV